MVPPSTTESQGEAYGFSLVYTGSYKVEIEKGSQGLTRVMLGLNSKQLSWPLAPGETFTSPEVVSVYSQNGIGGMSRSLHSLYRKHLMKSKYATSDRPTLLNSWEGVGFDYNQSTISRLAQEAANLGAKLFVMDDGWFGKKYPRNNATMGLGDWVPNPDKFPNGLKPLVNDVTNLKAGNTSTDMRFGIWVEMEMVDPNSTLYHEHPDWALHAGSYPRTLTRHQLVLNVAMPEVQDFIIKQMSDILDSADISYVKWDNNRGIDETPHPYTDHQYMLGMYRVFDTLMNKYPNVLWEGCASGGGRFDPGILQYFPQVWTSDDTDAVERIFIQMGTSLAYPPSAMGGHISAVPNGQTGRSETMALRGHVAMMAGSFGMELDPADLPEEEKAQIPGLVALAERINPIILNGDMWRLNLPEESNWPAVQFISEDGSEAVLFYFQLRPLIDHVAPRIRLQGLDPQAMYHVENRGTYSGSMLMNMGLQIALDGQFSSEVVLLQKQ